MPRRLFHSFKYAGQGIKHAFWTQRNIRIHLAIAVLAFILGLYLKLTYFELVTVILAICFVLITEMINTAIEEVVNLVSPTRRARATIAKDVAAGAVLFAAFCAILVGCLIFIPHILNLFF